jgi:hypothetical protein
VYIRKTTIHKDGKIHYYWALVESYRTERGPRQRVVAWLGEMDEAGRLGVKSVAEGTPGFQPNLFEKTPEPEWVEIDIKRVRVENVVEFGGPWLGLELMHCLGLDQFFIACSRRSGGSSMVDHGGGISAMPGLSSIERTSHCRAFF